MLIRSSLKYGPGVTYDAASTAYFAAMSVQPNATRKGLIDALIVGLKADGVWTPLDWLCLVAAHDEQAGRVNAKQPAKVLTATNSPVFTADRGFAGDAVSSYLDVGEAPNAAGNNFSLNDGHVGIYCNLDGAATSLRYHHGQVSGATLRIGVRSGGISTAPFRISDATDTVQENNPATSKGHRIITRPDAANKFAYLNGGNQVTAAVAATAITVANMSLMRSAATYSADRAAAFHSGTNLSAAQAAAISTRLHTYMTAIGANY